jgi:hypothetical protein
MRTTRSFVLRLMFDPDEPQALRGTLRAVDDEAEQTFADERQLVQLLHELQPQPPAPDRLRARPRRLS